jgi:hypothetical protein
MKISTAGRVLARRNSGDFIAMIEEGCKAPVIRKWVAMNNASKLLVQHSVNFLLEYLKEAHNGTCETCRSLEVKRSKRNGIVSEVKAQE